MVFRNIVFTRLFKLRLNQNDTIVDLNSNLKKKKKKIQLTGRPAHYPPSFRH